MEIIPTHLLLQINVGKPNWSSGRKIKVRRCLFTFSIQREIRHFHVVVVKKRQRKVKKKCDARIKLLFCLLDLLRLFLFLLLLLSCYCCCFVLFWRSRHRRVVKSQSPYKKRLGCYFSRRVPSKVTLHSIQHHNSRKVWIHSSFL